jgi:hypothetical protein
MKYLIHTFIFLAITSCTIQKSQLDLNEEFDGNYEVKENDTGVYAIAFDSDEIKFQRHLSYTVLTEWKCYTKTYYLKEVI